MPRHQSQRLLLSLPPECKSPRGSNAPLPEALVRRSADRLEHEQLVEAGYRDGNFNLTPEGEAWFQDNARRRAANAGRQVRCGAIRWKPNGERGLKVSKTHHNYHWSGDWSLAVEGAYEAQRRALQQRRGAWQVSLAT